MLLLIKESSKGPFRASRPFPRSTVRNLPNTPAILVYIHDLSKNGTCRLHCTRSTVSPSGRSRRRLLCIPGQVCMITEFSSIQLARDFIFVQCCGCSMPWFHEMSHSEQNTENHTDASNNNVGNAKERILAAHYRPGRYQDLFRASVHLDGEV